MENEVLRILYGQDRVIGEFADPIKVNINQFYGIEINDFACSVAQTALWIAESQMLMKTDEIVGFNLDPLPLKTYTNIHEGNALRMNWNDVVPASELNYIMGNPPFLGYTQQSLSQKQELQIVCPECGRNIDYVFGWYFKCVEFLNINEGLRCALVSTSSISQGEQVVALWKNLRALSNITINYAYRPFKWDNDANVNCVIIGFSKQLDKTKLLFYEDHVKTCVNINPYLLEGEDILVESRNTPLCNVPTIYKGSQPTDGGNLLLDEAEKDDIIRQAPELSAYIRPFLGADEFLNNGKRWCLWLINVEPSLLRKSSIVQRRIEAVREMRAHSSKAATRIAADTPTVFTEIRQPQSDYLLIPSTTSENRAYIPIGYISKEVISGNANLNVPDASVYHFGIMTSWVHMAWMRVVAGRLEMRYRYSAKIVYNNFPWPSPTEEQKKRIELAAQSILDARALYPNSSLADLYSILTMPPELRKAHRANDSAVLEAYGFPKDSTESDIVTRLFKMYQELSS